MRHILRVLFKLGLTGCPILASFARVGKSDLFVPSGSEVLG